MIYLKDLKFPFFMSGLIFIVSVLNLQKIDFYSLFLSVAYLIIGGASNVGGYYFDLTRQKKSAQAMFKIFVDPPGVFVLILGLFYMLTGDFHWIFIGVASFLTLIIFVIAFSDWDTQRKKEEGDQQAIDGKENE